jgi:hypothetical protein
MSSMHRLVRRTLLARPLRPILFPLLRAIVQRRPRSQIALGGDLLPPDLKREP